MSLNKRSLAPLFFLYKSHRIIVTYLLYISKKKGEKNMKEKNMKEKIIETIETIEETIEVSKSFCEGAALGAVTAIVIFGYDGLIRSLPLPVRLVADGAVATGCHILGMKVLEKLEE